MKLKKNNYTVITIKEKYNYIDGSVNISLYITLHLYTGLFTPVCVYTYIST